MVISKARAVAFDILLRVEQRDAFAGELLHSERLDGLSPADRRLCTELVMGTLRWQSSLDDDIAAHLKQKLAKLDREVLIALRLAAYQLRFLDRIPPSAAVNESVELVRRAKKKSAVPFANFVLRKLAAASHTVASDRSLASEFAHPSWIVERWTSSFGAIAARAICEYDQAPPVTAIRIAADADSVERELTSDGITLTPGRLARGARRVLSGDITGTSAFREGRIAIQDEASQLVALLVGTGKRILDCCAAPGGKTAVLAERNPQASIVAAELHPHRARLLSERLRNHRVDVVTADATALPYGAEFDRVLADAPCTGTGTLARNPEIKWKLSRADLRELPLRQIAILEAALRHVAPGGRLVYSTCSLEPEENSAVIERILSASKGFHLVSAADELARLRNFGDLACDDPESLLQGPYLRTLPGIHPADGFFAAIIERDG